MLSLGLLMAILFAWQGTLSLLTPGLGLSEAYHFGGLVLAGWLITGGISEWKAHCRESRETALD